MKKWALLCICFAVSFGFCNAPDDQVHEFAGKHFFGSYTNCDKQALADVQGMLNAMDLAVEASGATILDRTHHQLKLLYFLMNPPSIALCYLNDR